MTHPTQTLTSELLSAYSDFMAVNDSPPSRIRITNKSLTILRIETELAPVDGSGCFTFHGIPLEVNDRIPTRFEFVGKLRMPSYSLIQEDLNDLGTPDYGNFAGSLRDDMLLLWADRRRQIIEKNAK